MYTALSEIQPSALQTLLALRSVEGQVGFTERNHHEQRPWGTNQHPVHRHVRDLLCGDSDSISQVFYRVEPVGRVPPGRVLLLGAQTLLLSPQVREA